MNQLKVRLRGTSMEKWLPKDNGIRISRWEMIALMICNLVTTVGLIGDISRHLIDPSSLENDFLSGWHLVLYGGVLSVGLWVGLGAIKHGPSFIGHVWTTVLGFMTLSAAGAADMIWHEVFGVEAAVESLVSPPHLLVLIGLTFLLTGPIHIIWQTESRTLGVLDSVIVLSSLVSAILVVMLFTGYLSPMAGGLQLQVGYTEPLIGESVNEYDQVRGLGIAIWTSAVLSAGFIILFVRFKFATGMVLASFLLISAPSLAITGTEVWPIIVGFGFAGLMTEICVWSLGSPTLGRVGAAVTGFMLGITLWTSVFLALKYDGRLEWEPTMWTGAAMISGIVGAAVGSLVAMMPPREVYLVPPVEVAG